MERAGKIDISVVDRVLRVFSVRMLDMDACRGVVLGALHPGGVRCPDCGELAGDARRIERLMAGDRVACSKCSKRFSALSGTFLSGAHMDFRGFVLLVWMHGEGIRPVRIAELLGMDPTTVRSWCRKLEDHENGS